MMMTDLLDAKVRGGMAKSVLNERASRVLA
jgi:hypothetical protein